MMKKMVLLSLSTSTLIMAADVTFEAMNVEAPINELSVTNISKEDLKSADLAEALTKSVPSLTLVRRSGIANDLILRGQKKDNINVLIDNAKIYGACPNRMDPTTAHILSNNVEKVTIIEGPYDVENFGTLSGMVKVETKEPTKDLHGDVNVNFGDFSYQKASASVSGGSDALRLLLSASTESSDQYLDGNGDNFAGQIEKLNPTSDNNKDPRYQDPHKKAYTKSTFMGKLFFKLTDDQKFKLSYTLNRSENVLYPSSSMDALYDNSDIINASYDIKNLGSASKLLHFDYFYSFVDHPMVTDYRVSALYMPYAKKSALTSATQGFKVINSMNLQSKRELKYGVDSSQRLWNGSYYINNILSTTQEKSIDDAQTLNGGIFLEAMQKYRKTDLKVGVRYDYTDITTADATQQNRTFQSVNAYLHATLHAPKDWNYFAGLGRSSRVPDPRELYFYNMMGMSTGTDTLSQTYNNEIDLGVEKSFESSSFKFKLFYSLLENYIVYNASLMANNFENVDATIYGASLNGSVNFTPSLYSNYGIAYQRGVKANALTNQTNTNLAEIPPLKLNAALNYEPSSAHTLKVEVIAADAWNDFDSDNGEQKIDAYAILNLKYAYRFAKKYGVTLGVDNLFNRVYNTTNTYKDLTLIADTNGDVMLINEPGRYAYVNLSYKY